MNIEVGQLVEINFEGQVLQRKIYKIGQNNPFFDHVMLEGILHWFHISELIEIK